MGDPSAREALLLAAERTCSQRGVQLTPLRREVLALVLEAEAPIGAYALLDRLKATRPRAAPPTVYRALDFLLEQGLIHKIERLNAYIGCTEAAESGAKSEAHPHQFLICRRCGATTEIADRGVSAAIAAAAHRAGFAVIEATVEIEGVCRRCSGQDGDKGGNLSGGVSPTPARDRR